MKALTESMRQPKALLADAAAAAADGEVLAGSDAISMQSFLQAFGGVQRLLDGLLVEATAQILDREGAAREDRLTTQSGARDASELLCRTLRIDGITARRYVNAGRSAKRVVELTSGCLLPARYEALHTALREGVMSLSGYTACTKPFDDASSRLSLDDVTRADLLLANAARGYALDDAPNATPGPTPTCDELAVLAHQILAYIDPDGAEPVDVRADRGRHVTLGLLRGGAVPLRGSLLPEVAGQLQRIIDSILNPRVADDFAGVSFRPSSELNNADFDDEDADSKVVYRTHAQKRHDALATALTFAAASGGLPTIGGAAPTLVVSVTAESYAADGGRATIAGRGWSVSASVARHTACAGGVQRVLFDEHGSIVGIGTTARIFNSLQRRAIAVRDRECVIPGCTVEAEWCEIHHATEWAHGGPTRVDNGMLLCWHHHRTLETSGWHVRMHSGYPEIRGPAWWDPEQRWRRPRIRHGSAKDLEKALSG